MLDRLSGADRLEGAGATVAIVGTLLPWYHFTEGASTVTTNGFGAGFLGDVTFLAAAAMLLALLVRHGVIDLGRDLGDRRVDMGLGLVALGAVVLQLLIGVNGSGAFHHASIGLVVALVAGAAMAAGASLGRKDTLGHHSPAMRRR